MFLIADSGKTLSNDVIIKINTLFERASLFPNLVSRQF